MSEEHQRQASLGHSDALIQANYIKLNLKGLNIIKGGKGKYYSVDNTAMGGHQISMKLPGINKPVLLNVENVQNLIADEDVVTYTGHVAEDSSYFFTLSVSDDGVMGKIYYGKHTYIIKPIEGPANKHSIAQLEKRLMTKDIEEEVIGNGQIEKSASYSKSSSSGRVDILFYYASDVSNPSLLASTIVSEMNATLSRSGVSSTNYIHSVGVLPTNTQTGVNVSSGTWYLRAQACNASGCSPYSNQVTANRISSCL